MSVIYEYQSVETWKYAKLQITVKTINQIRRGPQSDIIFQYFALLRIQNATFFQILHEKEILHFIFMYSDFKHINLETYFPRSVKSRYNLTDHIRRKNSVNSIFKKNCNFAIYNVSNKSKV